MMEYGGHQDALRYCADAVAHKNEANTQYSSRSPLIVEKLFRSGHPGGYSPNKLLVCSYAMFTHRRSNPPPAQSHLHLV